MPRFSQEGKGSDMGTLKARVPWYPESESVADTKHLRTGAAKVERRGLVYIVVEGEKTINTSTNEWRL